jgi:hypothetical protein
MSMPSNVPQPEPPQLRAIRQAAQGLEYPSESDAPFETFWWPTPPPAKSSARDAVAARVAKDRKIEELTPDQFFTELERSDDGARFTHLRQTLESQLISLHVCRVGPAPRIDIYLLGPTRSGVWSGLHTTSVET